MPLYRLEATVDLQDLSDVLGLVTSAAGRHKLDPRITLSLIPEPPPDEAADIVHRLHLAPAPPKARKQKHVQKGDNSWPAPGSIYSTVLEALGDGPQDPQRTARRPQGARLLSRLRQQRARPAGEERQGEEDWQRLLDRRLAADQLVQVPAWRGRAGHRPSIRSGSRSTCRERQRISMAATPSTGVGATPLAGGAELGP